VNDVAHTRFSPDGHFLAATRESESVIELWNLEDGKDPRQFSYPPGNLTLPRFSLASDSLIAVSWGDDIYLWRLDTQEIASFSHDFNDMPYVIHSPVTNYLFIKQPYIVEIWNVSVTGSILIWKTNPPTISEICSICPSRDGHRLLVGCDNGSVRMWDVDLENLMINQTDSMDTQADINMAQFIAFSHSGKMVATKSERSHSVEFLDTTTGEVVAHTDFDDNNHSRNITFSLDEDQVAFWSKSLITICDIMHPDNHVLFNWPRKDTWIRKVAFQTCNNLVICALLGYLLLLQVWHRQDPAGFKCTYSSDFQTRFLSNIFKESKLSDNEITVVHFMYLPKKSKLFTSE